MADHECERCHECDSCPACAADALDREVVENERLRLALEAATHERDEARRHAEERLADVLELRFCGIEFVSQYGDRALACRYDNSCDDSGREPSCVQCAFRRALGQKEVDRG